MIDTIEIASREFELELGKDETVVKVDGLVSPPITLTYVPYGGGKFFALNTYVFYSKVMLAMLVTILLRAHKILTCTSL